MAATRIVQYNLPRSESLVVGEEKRVLREGALVNNSLWDGTLVTNSL